MAVKSVISSPFHTDTPQALRFAGKKDATPPADPAVPADGPEPTEEGKSARSSIRDLTDRARDTFLTYTGIKQAKLDALSALLEEVDLRNVEGLKAADPLIDLLQQINDPQNASLDFFKDNPQEGRAFQRDLARYIYLQAPNRELLLGEFLKDPAGQKVITSLVLPGQFVKALGQENCAKLFKAVYDNPAYRERLGNGDISGLVDALVRDPQLEQMADGSFQRKLLKALKQPALADAFLHPEKAFLALNPELREKAFMELLAQQDVRALLITFICNVAVGPGKIGQFMSSDESVSPEIRESLDRLLSRNIPTRTMAQAQEAVDKLFGEGKYKVEGDKPLGVATVGEVYAATRVSDGKDVVIKMLKQGVSAETLEQEWVLLQRLVKAIYTDPQQRAYKLNQFQTLYRLVMEELNYTHEVDGARKLSDGATRYNVAAILEMSTSPINPKQGLGIVMERAPGIQMSCLADMLKVYQQDPAKYRRQFAEEIEAHPWLAEPEKWQHELPQAYLRAFTEQMFLRQGPLSIFRLGRELAIHGDPHAGNVFIAMDEKTGKLKPCYIDTGLTIPRDFKLLLRNAGLVVDTVVGNSRGIATRLVDMSQSLPEGIDRDQLITNLAKDLHQILFEKPINLQKPKLIDQVIDALLQKHQILLKPEQQGFTKAQAQTMLVYKQLSNLTGQNQNKFLRDVLWDILQGVGLSVIRHPIEAAKAVIPALIHLYKNWQESLRTLFQFIL